MERNSDLYNKFIQEYWEYYLELEDEFLQTKRYVDFSKPNYSTYSVEFLKLYQAICGEIDVIGKAMAKLVDSSFSPDDGKNNILKWWFIVQDEFSITERPFTPVNPTASKVSFSLNDYACVLPDEEQYIPWKKFVVEQYVAKDRTKRLRTKANAQTPSWWRDYNDVKHNRTSRIPKSNATNYSKANLGNVLKALAGLYTLERAYMDTIGTEDDLNSFMDFSKLFVKQRRYTSSEIKAVIDNLGLKRGPWSEEA